MKMMGLLFLITGIMQAPADSVVLNLSGTALTRDGVDYFSTFVSAPTNTYVYDVSALSLWDVETIELKAISVNGGNFSLGGGNGLAVKTEEVNWLDYGEPIDFIVTLKNLSGTDITSDYNIDLVSAEIRSGEDGALTFSNAVSGSEIVSTASGVIKAEALSVSTSGYDRMFSVSRNNVSVAFQLNDVELNVVKRTNMTVNVDAPDTTAVSLSLQDKIDSISAAGGGVLYLRDTSASSNGSVMVTTTLEMKEGVALVGHSSGSPRIWGADDTGISYRITPLIHIGSGAHETSVKNLYFDGDENLQRYGILVEGEVSNYLVNVEISDCEMANIRQHGIQVDFVRNCDVLRNNLTMKYDSTLGVNAGGSGIRFKWVEYGTVSNNVVTAPTWYEAGYPERDPRGDNEGMTTYDHIAALGGLYNKITYNILSYGNCGGIYLSPTVNPSVQQERYCTVAYNIVDHQLENGIDLNQAYNPDVHHNYVQEADFSGIWVFACDGGTLHDNFIERTGVDLSFWEHSQGALTLGNNARNLHIYNNDIFGDSNEYAIYFHSMTGVAVPLNNTIESNCLWEGNSDFIGDSGEGIDASNVFTGNSEYAGYWFADDFSNGLSTTDWQLSTTGWSVSNEVLQSSSSGTQVISLKNQTMDYVNFTCRIKVDTIGSWGGIQLRKSLQNAFPYASGYLVHVKKAAGNTVVTLYKPGGAIQTHTLTDVDCTTDFVEIQVVAEDDEISVYADKFLCFSVVDSSYSSGYVGLASYNTSAYFDDVSIISR